MHVFYIGSGFQYFFVKELIRCKDIEHPIFITRFDRASDSLLLKAIKGENSLVLDIKGSKYYKYKGNRRIRRIISDLSNIDSSRLDFYSAHYRSRVHIYFINEIKNHFEISSFNLIPDGANLLLDDPGILFWERSIGGRFWYLRRCLLGMTIPNISMKHNSGSFSEFINKIFHFRSKNIYAPQTKIEFIKINSNSQYLLKENNTILLVGGNSGFSDKVADWISVNFPQNKIFYRPHPNMSRSKKRYNSELRMAKDRKFKVLIDINIPLEELILKENFSYVMGSFSTTLVISHLFFENTKSIFLYDRTKEHDKKWKKVAEEIGLETISVGL